MQKQTMKNRLEKIAEFDGMTLYKRVASNGSSAWAWVGGPPYVLTNSKGEIVGEFDWHSDAIAKANELAGCSEVLTAFAEIKSRFTEPCSHGIQGHCDVCSSPEEMAKKQPA